MKIKNLLSLVLTITSFVVSASAFAENVSYKAPELNGKITVVTNNLELTDWQAVMSCHFDYKGSRKESVRTPQTFVKKIGKNEYSLTSKKGSLTEFMIPNWRLLTCAYKLILIGKNTDTQRSTFGEIYLLGQEHGEMDQEDLKAMQNRDYVAKVLAEKTRDLRLAIAPEGGIVAE
jgi:hypothetical protein